MKVSTRQVDFNTVELTITATGKAGDDLNLLDPLYLPYNGPYTIDWGDNSAWQVVPQNGNNPTVVTHDYSGNGAWRISVQGDALLVVHGLSSVLAA